MDFLLNAAARTVAAQTARESAPEAEIRPVDVEACQLCGISYLNKGERLKPLQNLGYELLLEKTAWFVVTDKDLLGTSTGSGRSSASASRGFIVFRGTASLRDVITDCLAKPTEGIATYSAGGLTSNNKSDDNFSTAYLPRTQFHSGIFANVVENLKLRAFLELVGLVKRQAPGLDQIRKKFEFVSSKKKIMEVANCCTTFPIKRWFFCGHSLGGGCAQLCLTLLEKGFFESSASFPSKASITASLQQGEGSSCEEEKTQERKNKEQNGAPSVAAATPPNSGRSNTAAGREQAQTATTSTSSQEFAPIHRIPIFQQDARGKTATSAGQNFFQLEAISFASPPIYFDPLHQLSSTSGAPASSTYGVENQTQQEQIDLVSNASTISSSSSQPGRSRKSWLPHEQHKIRAFVYGSDPIPRLDRQEDNVLLTLLGRYNRTASMHQKLLSVNHYIHHPNEYTVWMLPDILLQNLHTAKQVGKFVFEGAKNLFSRTASASSSKTNNTTSKDKERNDRNDVKSEESSQSGLENGTTVGGNKNSDTLATRREKIKKENQLPQKAGGGAASSSLFGAAAGFFANVLEASAENQKQKQAVAYQPKPRTGTGDNITAKKNNMMTPEGEAAGKDLIGTRNPETVDAREMPPETKAIVLSSEASGGKFSRAKVMNVNDSNPSDHLLSKYEFGFKNHYRKRDALQFTPLYEVRLEEIVN
ncbi:unnamed protein product [Amoebophrya sp. A120]|nr:unnamed protein product [Amoebophrya sp. A120]|eukprot:GSA120T00017220001.1